MMRMRRSSATATACDGTLIVSAAYVLFTDSLLSRASATLEGGSPQGAEFEVPEAGRRTALAPLFGFHVILFGVEKHNLTTGELQLKRHVQQRRQPDSDFLVARRRHEQEEKASTPSPGQLAAERSGLPRQRVQRVYLGSGHLIAEAPLRLPGFGQQLAERGDVPLAAEAADALVDDVAQDPQLSLLLADVAGVALGDARGGPRHAGVEQHQVRLEIRRPLARDRRRLHRDLAVGEEVDPVQSAIRGGDLVL